MSLYKGTVTRSILDYYAENALAAQQWFSQSIANYWSFTLSNNATDGSRIYVYDAHARSSAAVYPAGTGNPGGNPNPVVGPNLTPPIITAWQLVSQHQDGANNQPGFGANLGGNAIAGELLLCSILSNTIPASAIVPTDPGFSLVAGVDGDANSPCVTVWAKVSDGTEGTIIGFANNSGANQDYSSRGMRFTGNAPSGVVDLGVAQVSLTNTNAPIAPAIQPNLPGDLLYCIWANFNSGFNITGNPAFTLFPHSSTFGPLFTDGFMTLPATSLVGPFAASMSSPNGWSAASGTLKAATTATAPGQVQQSPINVLGSQLAGILKLQYSTTALGLTGITTWLPPACTFDWAREAPIAIIQPGTNYNLAGIAPELAAWGSMQWISVK